MSLTDSALSQVPSRRGLIADAAAAIVAVLPSGAATRLRSLDAWVQQPGNDAVCGEVEVDASGSDGRLGGTRWRSFFAARGDTGGWHAFSPQVEENGWRIGVNPTDLTAAGQERCHADMRRPPIGDGSDGARDAEIMRRCPIAASTFWTDYQMTCAGHQPPR